MGLKIAVIGGASSYTPELFATLLEDDWQLDIQQVSLYDPNHDKLNSIAGVCRGLLRGPTQDIGVSSTQDREEAISGADFILLQIRVGGLGARVRDEKIPMELGMVGNETIGAGGFVCGLRTVTAALEIAREIERCSPNAWLVNLSNPAGIVTEAILRHTAVRAIGFCNIPINTQYDLSEVLNVPPEKIVMDYFGLNHLSWVRGAYVNGRELLQPLLAGTRSRGSVLYRKGLVDATIDPELLVSLGMVPRWYNRYFDYPEKTLREDRRHQQVKGEEDMQAEEKLKRIYAASGYNQEARQISETKGGARYYLPVLEAVEAIVNDTGKVVIVDVKNGSAITDLPSEAVVEVPARVRKAVIEPLLVGPLPLSVRGLMQTVKAYEELTIQAAVSGDHSTAIAALMAHPLVRSYPKARAFFERVLENERLYLPQFYAYGSN